MQSSFPFRVLALVLLAAAGPFAHAQSSLPDPIAPAVIGRWFNHLWQPRPVHEKPAGAKGARHKRPSTAHATTAKSSRRKSSAAHPVTTRLQDGQPTAHAAKQALDDRADPRVRVDDVGKGTHFARKPLEPGVYIGDSHRSAVLKYYAEHPAPAAPASWKIGEPLPSGAHVAPVPQGLLASLPRVPPGYRYVELGGDVVMIASGSKLVVDGVSRAAQ